MKSTLKETSSLEPLGINFFGLSMHFPHKLGKRDGKINWIGRSEHFGTFWATLMALLARQCDFVTKRNESELFLELHILEENSF